MQKALQKQKGDIELVSELNATLKTNKVRLEEKMAKLELEIRKEKDRRIAEVEKEKNRTSTMLESLNETDQQKLRTSQRLQTQDKEMDRMNMLYRQIASQKAALNREKELISEKLEKKRQKHAYTKQQLEETTKSYERLREENQSFGQIISQVMTALKNKDQNQTQLRASLARISQQQQFGQGIGGLNSSHISGMNTSQLNRNSNIKKVIRGGQGSIYHRPQRSSTMVGDMAQMLMSGNGAEKIR